MATLLVRREVLGQVWYDTVEVPREKTQPKQETLADIREETNGGQGDMQRQVFKNNR